MKRVLSIVLAVMCIICLAACGQDAPAVTEPATTPAATVPAATEPVATEPAATEPEESTETVQVDEGLLTVTLTIPASYFGMDPDSMEIDDDFAAEQGYISAEVTEDGNLVIVMTKAKQQELLDAFADGIDEMISNYQGGEETPYIQEITYTENFTEFTVKVDREGYEKAEYDMTPASLGLSAALYQMFAGIPANITVNVVDAATSEVIWSSAS